MSLEIVDVEEMVAMFLHVLAHDVKNREIQWEFVRSSETVSQDFNIVLLAVLWDELLKKSQPVTNECKDPRWRWFEAHFFKPNYILKREEVKLANSLVFIQCIIALVH